MDQELKISDTCRENIKRINNMIEEAQNAVQRAKIAESLLEKVKLSATQEIQNAYQKGFDDGRKIENPDSGSNNEDEDKKLELKD